MLFTIYILSAVGLLASVVIFGKEAQTKLKAQLPIFFFALALLTTVLIRDNEINQAKQQLKVMGYYHLDEGYYDIKGIKPKRVGP